MMLRQTLLSLLTLSTLSACTPVTAQRGNMVEDISLEKVIIGESTRSDVLRQLGSPTTVAPFNEDIWYYIGQETEKRGILDPEVIEERIIVVSFDANGQVDQLSDVDDGRINIPIERDSTPTHGQKNSAVQQLLGNIGKFNPQEE